MYQLLPVSINDIGSYKCVIGNSCGTANFTSNLNVNAGPSILNTIENQIKCEGADVTFNISATGTALKYQWTKGFANISNATNTIYTKTNLKIADGDIYSCNVSNSCGSKSLKAYVLMINQKPKINIIPITQIKNIGDSLAYYLSPGGTPPFTYQWLKDNAFLAGSTGNSYKVQYLTPGDQGIYSCIVTNQCGSSTVNISTLIIKIESGLAISGQIKYDNANSSPLKNTKVVLNTLDGVKVDSTLTDNYGVFIFNNVKNGTFKLSCQTNIPWGGVDPLDALLINRYFIQLSVFKDLMMQTAADVNIDLRINPLDALLVNRRFVQIIS